MAPNLETLIINQSNEL